MDDVLSALAAVAGVALLVLATYDALRTTIAPTAGAGPLTKSLSRLIWVVARYVASGPRARVLTTVGTLVLLLSIAAWVLLLWAGWTLLFAADADAIVRSSGEPAGVWDLVYFTGFTIFTLGVGDLFPVSPLWQVLTPVATLHGLFLLTLSITYLVPVMGAAVDRRSQAANLWAMGGSASSIVSSGWHLGSFEALDRSLQSLAVALMRTAERHPTYPALNYFHTGEARSDFRARIAALDDAVSLLLHAVPLSARPTPATLTTLQRVVDDLLRSAGHANDRPGDPPPLPDLAPLVAAGVPVRPRAEIEEAFARLSDRRRRLYNSVTEVGWDWSAVEAAPAP